MASQGRRIILSTGRGDTRITIDEAYDLERTFRVAITDQRRAETEKQATRRADSQVIG